MTEPEITRRQFFGLAVAGIGSIGAGAPPAAGSPPAVGFVAGRVLSAVNALGVHRRLTALEDRRP